MAETSAQSEMKKIAVAAEKFRRDFARAPHSVQELIDNEFMIPGIKAHEQWEFEVNWPDDVYAFSTDKHPSGKGITISYKIPEKI
jgi:hypothetical protein